MDFPTKTCPACGLDKSSTSFYSRENGRLRTRCKTCTCARVARRRLDRIAGIPARMSEGGRFFSKLRKTPTCWLWTGETDRDGYGRMTVKRDGLSKWMGAHRLSWEIANGEPVPVAGLVLHRCHVRSCVNPDHLYIGTSADNMADRAAAGHYFAPNPQEAERRCRNHPNTVLSPDQVRIARRLSESGEPNQKIADRFGVTRSTIWAAVHRKTFRFID